MDFLNKRINFVQNKVKQIDENVKKLKMVSINKSSISPSTLSSLNNLMFKKKFSLFNEKKQISFQTVDQFKNTNIIRNRASFNIKNIDDKNDNFSNNKDSFIKSESPKHFQRNSFLMNQSKFKSIDNKSVTRDLENEILEKRKKISSQDKKNLENIKSIQNNRNYKRLKKMKNYDFLVTSLFHVSEFISSNKKEEFNQSTLDKIIAVNKFKEGSPQEIQNYNILPIKIENSMIDEVPKEEGKKSNISSPFSKNIKKHLFSNNSRRNKSLNQNNNNTKEKFLNNTLVDKPKIVDRHKVKLNQIYKMDPLKIDELKKVYFILPR